MNVTQMSEKRFKNHHYSTSPTEVTPAEKTVHAYYEKSNGVEVFSSETYMNWKLLKADFADLNVFSTHWRVLVDISKELFRAKCMTYFLNFEDNETNELSSIYTIWYAFLELEALAPNNVIYFTNIRYSGTTFSILSSTANR